MFDIRRGFLVLLKMKSILDKILDNILKIMKEGDQNGRRNFYS